VRWSLAVKSQACRLRASREAPVKGIDVICKLKPGLIPRHVASGWDDYRSAVSCKIVFEKFSDRFAT
jgi:hypothetical protein